MAISQGFQLYKTHHDSALVILLSIGLLSLRVCDMDNLYGAGISMLVDYN